MGADIPRPPHRLSVDVGAMCLSLQLRNYDVIARSGHRQRAISVSEM